MPNGIKPAAYLPEWALEEKEYPEWVKSQA